MKYVSHYRDTFSTKFLDKGAGIVIKILLIYCQEFVQDPVS